jgi:hypothetical protein
MSTRNVGETVTVCKEPFSYNSHPCVAMLDNGEWVTVFKHAERLSIALHPTEFPLYHTMLTRSGDQGRTWSKPTVVPDYDWYGTEVPGVVQLRDGTLIVSQFRFAWYPLGLARKRQLNGEPVFLFLPLPGGGHEWTNQIEDDDWGKSFFPWARGPHGLYVHISRDYGYTFEDAVRIDCSPYHDGYNRTAVVELSDGRIAHAVTEQHVPPSERNLFVLFSSTSGRSWQQPVLLSPPIGGSFRVGEPHLAEVGPNELVCVIRDTPDGSLGTHVQTSGFLQSCRSYDGGQSWSHPEPTPLLGHPGHLLMLSDGRLLCTYGRRVPPYGVRACLSEDGGRTWRADDEIVIRSDLSTNDVGYATTIEYEPGSLFTAYYGGTSDGVTGVEGTYFDL